VIRRFNEPIGTEADIVVLGPADVKLTPADVKLTPAEAGCAMLNVMFGPSWRQEGT
jgi:hypothetical protein